MKIFEKFLEKLFFPEIKRKELTGEEFLRVLKKGDWTDKFVFGLSDHDYKILAEDSFQEAHCLFAGKTGSGKSWGSFFTFGTHYLANNGNTVYFVADMLKGAGTYKLFLDLPHVYKVVDGSSEGVRRVISLIHDELKERMKVFNQMKPVVESVPDYERSFPDKKKFARIILLLEEAHSIFNPVFEWDKNYKTVGTIANKFSDIIKAGRSYGIQVIVVTQRALSSDIPPGVLQQLSNRNVFKTGQAESHILLGNEDAASLPKIKGRCITQFGSMQFPYFEMKDWELLIKHFKKPFDAQFAYLNDQVIRDHLCGKSTEDLYRNKKISTLIEEIEVFEPSLVIGMLHKQMGDLIRDAMNHEVDPFGISHVILQDNVSSTVTTAIMPRIGENCKVTEKHLQLLRAGMEEYGCGYGIMYTSASPPSALYKKAKELNIGICDKEDLIRLGRQVESNKIHKKKVSSIKLISAVANNDIRDEDDLFTTLPDEINARKVSEEETVAGEMRIKHHLNDSETDSSNAIQSVDYDDLSTDFQTDIIPEDIEIPDPVSIEKMPEYVPPEVPKKKSKGKAREAA